MNRTNEPQEIIKNAADYFHKLSLDTYEDIQKPKPEMVENYTEKNDLISDITAVILNLEKLGYLTRTTKKTSVEQTVHISTQGYIRILGINSPKKAKKSKTTFAYHRVKYILAHKGLSDLAKIRIISDKKKVKKIDVDHIDGNTLNCKLSNLQAIPHKVNINKHYRNMQKMNLYRNKEKYAFENDCEELLVFLA